MTLLLALVACQTPPAEDDTAEPPAAPALPPCEGEPGGIEATLTSRYGCGDVHLWAGTEDTTRGLRFIAQRVMFDVAMENETSGVKIFDLPTVDVLAHIIDGVDVGECRVPDSAEPEVEPTRYWTATSGTVAVLVEDVAYVESCCPTETTSGNVTIQVCNATFESEGEALFIGNLTFEDHLVNPWYD